MKKSILFFSFCLIAPLLGIAQKPNAYKVPFSGADKRVHIFSSASVLLVQGSTGTDVVIETDGTGKQAPQEAEGLRVVTAGIIDNTGVGVNVEVEGGIMTIKIPKRNYFGNFVIKIPKSVGIMLKESGATYDGKWLISDFDGEVEANTGYANLTIKDVSGPIVARGGYGKMKVIYSKLNASKPNSISASGAVDVSLPADTKTSIKLKSQYGDVFTDFDILAAKEEKPKQATSTKAGDDASEEPSIEERIFNAEKAVEKVDKALAKTFATIRPTAARIPKNASGTYGNANASGTYNDTKGNLYDRFGVKINGAAEATDDDCNCKDGMSNGTIVGTINGGGVVLNIKSDFGNVYLRKIK